MASGSVEGSGRAAPPEPPGGRRRRPRSAAADRGAGPGDAASPRGCGPPTGRRPAGGDHPGPCGHRPRRAGQPGPGAATAQPFLVGAGGGLVRVVRPTRRRLRRHRDRGPPERGAAPPEVACAARARATCIGWPRTAWPIRGGTGRRPSPRRSPKRSPLAPACRWSWPGWPISPARAATTTAPSSRAGCRAPVGPARRGHPVTAGSPRSRAAQHRSGGVGQAATRALAQGLHFDHVPAAAV